MAKVRSIFKLQGTLQGITHVHSRSYGYHVRAKRGTYTPAVVNDAFKEMSQQLTTSNVPARIVNTALARYCKDFTGKLRWQRLVSLFRRQYAEQGGFDFQRLEGFEISKEQPLDRLTSMVINTFVDTEASVMNVTLHLSNHPEFRKELKNVEGYRLNVIAIYPDPGQDTAATEMVSSAIIDLKSGSTEQSFILPIPQKAESCILCVKLEVVQKGRRDGITKGMRVVKVLKLEERDRREAQVRLRTGQQGRLAPVSKSSDLAAAKSSKRIDMMCAYVRYGWNKEEACFQRQGDKRVIPDRGSGQRGRHTMRDTNFFFCCPKS